MFERSTSYGYIPKNECMGNVCFVAITVGYSIHEMPQNAFSTNIYSLDAAFGVSHALQISDQQREWHHGSQKSVFVLDGSTAQVRKTYQRRQVKSTPWNQGRTVHQPFPIINWTGLPPTNEANNLIFRKITIHSTLDLWILILVIRTWRDFWKLRVPRNQFLRLQAGILMLFLLQMKCDLQFSISGQKYVWVPCRNLQNLYSQV